MAGAESDRRNPVLPDKSLGTWLQRLSVRSLRRLPILKHLHNIRYFPELARYAKPESADGTRGGATCHTSRCATSGAGAGMGFRAENSENELFKVARGRTRQAMRDFGMGVAASCAGGSSSRS